MITTLNNFKIINESINKIQKYLSTRQQMFSDEGKKLTKNEVINFLLTIKKSPYKYWIKSSEGYSYYAYKGQLYANDSTSGIFNASKITINNLKDNLTYKIQENELYDYEKEQDPTVKRPKNKITIWDSILTKFKEIYYCDNDSENDTFVSDQVKAEERVWQFDKYSPYSSPLSWKDAEKKFKESLTPKELKMIEISYTKERFADAESHDQEKYYKEIIVKLKK